MQIKLSGDNIINITHKTKIPIVRTCFGILFFLGIIFYGIFFFINDNQKIFIFCNKKENLCAIQTKKFFSPFKQKWIIYDKTKEADLHVVSAYLVYSIRIPYGNSYIEIYSDTENKPVLNFIVENFNKFKNDNSANILKLDAAPKRIYYGFHFFNAIILIILLSSLYLNIPIKTIITINCNNKELIIFKKFLLHKKSENIDFSKIKKITLEKIDSDHWHIRYMTTTKIGTLREMVCCNNKKEAEQIYEMLSVVKD